jgi:hypothetical protein
VSESTVCLRDVLVVGGGCYGTFYANQLAKAKARGKVEYRSVILVDRDATCRARRELGEAADRTFVTSEWGEFFDRYFFTVQSAAAGQPGDAVVPSPHMSHLMFEWLVRRTQARFQGRRVEVLPVPDSVGTPYDRTAANQTRYVSFADWICPTHCIEPAICPAIGAPRTWEMSAAVEALAERLRAQGRPIVGPVLFVCRHQVFGVGTFAVEAVLEGERQVVEAARDAPDVSVLVGTVSGCHGALNLLAVRPAA